MRVRNSVGRRLTLSLVILSLLLSSLVGCYREPTVLPNPSTAASQAPYDLVIVNGGRISLEIGSSYQLRLSRDEAVGNVTWTSSSGAATVDQTGLVTAVAEGKAAITVSNGASSASALIEVIPKSEHLDDVEREAFYQNYTPASSYAEALERSKHGLMSGSLTVPDQAPTLSEYQPTRDGQLIRNSVTAYLDNNTYVVVDAYGDEAFVVYRGGGYITLEEVAAYVYAFGEVPANYVEDKSAEPENSIWGEYLRLNHTAFSGNTKKYPYEPALPNISGCGGDLYYYEIDIGTTGTDCDPAYVSKIYNDGQTITRGAARIVYTRYDQNRNAILEPNEKFLFYTYNHYNDFQEYLNYEGGWGELFGNVTGGGTISSKVDYHPTPYVKTILRELPAKERTTLCIYTILPCFCLPEKERYAA
ncbi:MAG: Ig-like domain-containing protein [Clostridia bacterium]|nr:Ig-like domain-containing protein [Clostridia bacterium]